MLGLCLALALLVAEIDLRIDPELEDVDSDGVAAGLAIRLGERGDGWRIAVGPTESPDRLDVRLHSPGGSSIQRWVVLATEGEEERSRELASELAFVIESHEEPVVAPPPEKPPEPEPPPRKRGPSGIVAGGGSLGAGPLRDVDVSFGAGLRGAAFLVREHVVPVASVGWVGSRSQGLALDGVRFGVGLYGGAPLAKGLVWVGAGVLPRAVRVRADDRRSPATWTSSTEVAARVWVRVRWLAIGLRTGAELTFRPVRAFGNEGDVRWGPARYFVGLDVGVWVRGPTSG